MSNNVGIELSLRALARLAWRYRIDPAVHLLACRLTDDQPVAAGKVQAIVDHIHEHGRVSAGGDVREVFSFSVANPTLDADDAVLAAAALCLSGGSRAAGIPCRIVGARFDRSWTVWLAYQDGGEWVTVDVVNGGLRPVREPDERVVVAVEETIK